MLCLSMLLFDAVGLVTAFAETFHPFANAMGVAGETGFNARHGVKVLRRGVSEGGAVAWRKGSNYSWWAGYLIISVVNRAARESGEEGPPPSSAMRYV
jgi:hypothetical protein